MRTAKLSLALVILCVSAGVLSGQTTLSQSTDANTVMLGNSVACTNVFGQAENRYFRAYTTAVPFMATGMRFGVETDENAPTTLNLRLWNLTSVTPTTLTLGTQIGATTAINTPGNGSWNASVRTVFFNAPIVVPAGNFGVEVGHLSNQAVLGSFFFGSNQAGQSAPSFIMAPNCGLTSPSATNAPPLSLTIHYILDVIGYASPATAPDPEIDVRFPAGPLGTVASNGTINVGPLAPGVLNNVLVQIANQGLATNLTFGAPAISNLVNCTVPAPAAPAALGVGLQTNLTLGVTPAAGLGTFSFTVTIPNNDANEAAYVVNVQGTRGMSGTYTVGTGQAYADLGAAFNDLEALGVSGAVTLSVSAGLYTPNASYGLGSTGLAVLAPVRGLSVTNTLTITRASNSAVVEIAGSAAVDPNGLINGCMSVFGCSFVTINGLTFRDGVGFGLWVGHDSGRAGRSTNVTVRNCKFHSIGTGPGLVVVNDGTPMDNVLIQNCMAWACAGGNTFYGMSFPGAIALFYPGLNTIIEHCTVLNDAGFTSTAGVGQPGGIGYGGGFEAVRTSPTIRNCVMSATGAGRPCFWMPNDDPAQAATAGPYPPTAANRNVYFTQNGAQTVTAGFAGTAVQNFATLAAWQGGFPALDINSVEGDPLFTSVTNLHILNGSPAISLAVGSSVTTDIDGDPRPTGAAPEAGADEFNPGPPLSILATDPSAAEATPATQTGQFTLTFAVAPAAPVTVNFTMSGTASTTPGTDYVLSTTTPGVNLVYTGPTGTLTVPAATGTIVIVVTPVDELVNENPESVIFTINTGNGYDVGTPSNATVTITDNDLPPVPDFTVTASGTPSEAGAVPGTFTLTANPTPPTPVTVSFTLTGSSALNTDYTATATGSILVGVSGVATVTINPINDTTIEIGGETVILTLVGGAGYTISAPSSAQMIIADDDFPTVTVTGSGTPSETGPTTGTFTISATPLAPSPVTVHFVWSGAALQPGDYTVSAANSAVIPPGGSVNITITPVDDVDIETGGEDVTLTLVLNPGGPSDYVIGTPSQASRTIVDNDFPPVAISGTNPVHTLTPGTFNVAYSANISAVGGNGTFNWTVAPGDALPGGLTIANPSAGSTQISGTPTVAGTFNFTLQCTDGVTTDTQDYQLVLASGSIGSGSGSGGGSGGGCAAQTAGLAGSAMLAVFAGLAAFRRRRTK